MRMWNIKPELMCDKHLLGEHVEIHMFVGCLNKGKSVKGYLEKGLLEIHNLNNRHKNIIIEMKKRKFNHNSSLPDYKKLKKGKVNVKENLIELKNRCEKCRKRMKLNKK